MSEPIVSIQVDGVTAVITVNNPPVNTITAAVRAELTDAVRQLRGGPERTRTVLKEKK